MEVFALLFSLSVSFILLFSGFLKLLSIKEVTNMIEEMNIIPVSLIRILGVLVPVIELIIGYLLMSNSDSILVNIAAIILITFFILYNFHEIAKKSSKDCVCFGKIIKTKLGYGGLIQSLLLLMSLIPSLIFGGINLGDFINNQSNSVIIGSALITSFFWASSLLILRSLLETLLYPDLGNNKLQGE